MKERPILFSSEMIRAILAGRKTQTRRAVKLGFTDWQRDHSLAMMVTGSDGMPCFTDAKAEPSPAMMAMLRSTPGKPCPYGVPGDTLWVRETWAHDADSLDALRAEHNDLMAPEVPHGPYYRADGHHEASGLRWRPSIHMPRWASRITLPVTAVRVERLTTISEADSIAEGVESRAHYAALWDKINGRRFPWASDCWVWVLEFRVVLR